VRDLTKVFVGQRKEPFTLQWAKFSVYSINPLDGQETLTTTILRAKTSAR
jgi:hypothetical protein